MDNVKSSRRAFLKKSGATVAASLLPVSLLSGCDGDNTSASTNNVSEGALTFPKLPVPEHIKSGLLGASSNMPTFIGQGVKVFNGNTLQSRAVTIPNAIVTDFKTDVIVNSFTSKSDLDKKLDIDAQFSGSYNGLIAKGSVSAKVAFSKSVSETDNAIGILVRVRRSAVIKAQAINRFSIPKEVEKIIDRYNPKNGRFGKNFYNKYGDGFISEMTIGWEYLATISYSFKSKKERDELTASLEASYSSPTVDVAGSVSTAMKRIASQSRAEVTFNSKMIGTNLASEDAAKIVPPTATGGDTAIVNFANKLSEVVSTLQGDNYKPDYTYTTTDSANPKSEFKNGAVIDYKVNDYVEVLADDAGDNVYTYFNNMADNKARALSIIQSAIPVDVPTIAIINKMNYAKNTIERLLAIYKFYDAEDLLVLDDGFSAIDYHKKLETYVNYIQEFFEFGAYGKNPALIPRDELIKMTNTLREAFNYLRKHKMPVLRASNSYSEPAGQTNGYAGLTYEYFDDFIELFGSTEGYFLAGVKPGRIKIGNTDKYVRNLSVEYTSAISNAATITPTIRAPMPQNTPTSYNMQHEKSDLFKTRVLLLSGSLINAIYVPDEITGADTAYPSSKDGGGWAVQEVSKESRRIWAAFSGSHVPEPKNESRMGELRSVFVRLERIGFEE